MKRHAHHIYRVFASLWKHHRSACGEHCRTNLTVFAVFLVAAATAVFLRGAAVPVLPPPPHRGVDDIGAEIVWGDRVAREVLFSFDGGAGAESGEAILAALKKHGVTGTFFLTGKFAEENPALVRRIAREGHGVFNHTYAHRDLTTLSDEEIKGELARTDALIQNLTGESTKPYFRAPYGARNARVLAVAAEEGYQSVYWTTDVLDWKEATGFTAAEAKARIMRNLTPGAIFLMHIGDTITGAILDEVFTEIEAEGYALTSLPGTPSIARASREQ